MWPNPQDFDEDGYVYIFTFTEEILNEKLRFLCSEITCLY